MIKQGPEAVYAAASIAIGGMAVEFVRTHPEVHEQFVAWMQSEGSRGKKVDDSEVGLEALFAVDYNLTMMASEIFEQLGMTPGSRPLRSVPT